MDSRKTPKNLNFESSKEVVQKIKFLWQKVGCGIFTSFLYNFTLLSNRINKAS